MGSALSDYATYQRCVLVSPLLAGVYWLLTVALLVSVGYTAITSKSHLLLENLAGDGVLFARLGEQKGALPSCAALTNSTGFCVELPWLQACELSPSRGFVATAVEEALYLGRPPLQRLGAAAPAAPPAVPVRTLRFYVGQPEAWSLVLEHRLSSGLGVWSGQELQGFLREKQLTSAYSSPIEYAAQGLPLLPAARFGQHDGKDRRLQVRIGDLLAAAGVHLDQECSRCADFNKTGEEATLRNVGVELDVILFYTNLWLSWQDFSTWLLPAKEPSFELKVSARQPIEGVRTIRTISAAQSYFDPEELQNESVRVTRRAHGIRLHFRQQGVLGSFDTQSLGYFLLQSCTFLGVAWTLTELLCSMAPLLYAALRRPLPSWYCSLQPAPESSPVQLAPDKKTK